MLFRYSEQMRFGVNLAKKWNSYANEAKCKQW
jgi:hypothetical protein